MRKKSVLTSLIALSLSITSAAFAANESAFWNAASGDFNDPTNWTGPSGSVVPNGSGIGTIGNAGGTGVLVGGATLSGTASVAGITVGFGGNAQGSLVIDGGTFSATAGTFGLAGGSGGTLVLQNNGVANFGTGSMDFGRGSGVAVGAGTFLMTSGTFTQTGDIYFGGTTSTGNASKGYGSQSGGTATITTAGTNLRVGASQNSSTTGGQGTFALSDGTLNIPSTSIGLILGDGGGSFGTFLMSGGTLIFQNKGIDLGRNNGSGYAAFTAGTVSSGTIGIGGSALASVGGNGTGTMVVSGTANITMTSGNNLIVGAQQGNNGALSNGTSAGSLLIQGGTMTVNSTAFLGSGTTTAGSSKIAQGTLLVSGGLFAANTVQLGRNFTSSGYFGLSGGQANINNFNGPTDPSSTGTFDFTGGTLKLRDSSIDVTNNGGTFSPGGSGGVGTTGFADKSYTQNSGTLWIDINSGTFDTITTGAGTASIAGTINVATTDTLTVGQTFDVLVATLVTLDPGTAVTGTDGAGHPFSASVVNSGTTLELAVNDVPEPAVLSGSILTAAYLLKRRHRRGELKPPRRLRCA